MTVNEKSDGVGGGWRDALSKFYRKTVYSYGRVYDDTFGRKTIKLVKTKSALNRIKLLSHEHFRITKQLLPRYSGPSL